ncbi:MAG: glycosyltransferase family 2 protein [Bacteroidales bacterium]|jgi:glycosyltransferase involved in cell wall biosynthesis|nr:glycosyltransferase family 2 protein [Bacteroidales bacterium]
MEPNFSIIIPHHETPRLLSRLLASVPWSLQPEVIVVDDASGVEALAEVEKLRDEFDFQLYCIDRHTAGAARNEGLRHACGRWLIFADADDYFTSDAARLWQKHVSDTADVVFFDVTSAYSDSGRRAYRDRQVKRLIRRSLRERSLWPLCALHTNPWGKMVRRALVADRRIWFEEIPSANDAMFSVQVGVEAARVLLDESEMYCVTVSDGSLTSNIGRERFESNGEARLRVNAYLRDAGLGRYQLSVLNYLLGAWRYGFGYGCRVLRRCMANGNRPWVGFWHVFNPVNFYHSLKSVPK